jgi:hypothetical protein
VTFWDAARDNIEIGISPTVSRFLGALGLSLSELAAIRPERLLITGSLLRKVERTRYDSDIFVFMPFADELAPVYHDHMKAVADKLGKTIARADDFFTTEEIVPEIWTALLKTKLVIADCTGRNANVFYELGLAHAIGRRAIVTTQNISDIPFDLSHRRYIKYDMTPRGMKKFEMDLERTIRETLSDVDTIASALR